MEKGASGLTDSVVLAEAPVGKDVLPVWTGGEIGRGEEVGKPGGMGVVVVVVGGVIGFVLV